MRRAGLYLLAGVLVVGAIPVVATVRILEANALRNERTQADTALRGQLQSGLRELARVVDDASTHADDLARSTTVQRAFFTRNRAAMRRLAAREPGIAFRIDGRVVAGSLPAAAIRRSVSLTLNGRRIGELVATVPLDRKLAARLRRYAPHTRGDRLVIVRSGVMVGSGQKLVNKRGTVTLLDEPFRALAAQVPDSRGGRLLALRPESAIDASIAPYRLRIRYAAIGSFALLVLVALVFAGPIVRMLADLRRAASQATTDALTGIANRRTFDEELALEWRRAERVGDSLALILLDLDDFKRVNDTYGHQAGDVVLRRVAEALGSDMRQIDLFARYGGEEFGVLVPETELDGALLLAERLRSQLAAERVDLPDGHALEITASFGAAAKGSLARPEDLVAAADEALYEAKRNGKNRVAPELPATGSADKPAERRRPPARKKTAVKKAAQRSKAKAPAKKQATRKTKAAPKPAGGNPGAASAPSA
jgi:diguanylate cyclase (GGDEF)-like protein